MNRYDNPNHSFTWFSDFRMHTVQIGPDTDVLTFLEQRPLEILWDSQGAGLAGCCQLTSVHCVRLRISPTDPNAGVFCQMDIDASSKTLVFTVPIENTRMYCVKKENQTVLYWERNFDASQ